MVSSDSPGDLDAIALQAIVELKTREAQERGSALLLTLCALKHLDDQFGEPSRDRTEDPLIKSGFQDPRTSMHDEPSARDSEGW